MTVNKILLEILWFELDWPDVKHDLSLDVGHFIFAVNKGTGDKNILTWLQDWSAISTCNDLDSVFCPCLNWLAQWPAAAQGWWNILARKIWKNLENSIFLLLVCSWSFKSVYEAIVVFHNDTVITSISIERERERIQNHLPLPPLKLCWMAVLYDEERKKGRWMRMTFVFM